VTRHQKTEVDEVIREWYLALNANDVDRVKSIWDRTYDQLVYIAEENNEALYGWSGVEGYYDGLKSDVGSVEWKIDDLQTDVIGEAAWAYLTYVVEVEMKSFNRTMTFNGRNTFMLRKTDNQWKIIHYHESLSRDRSHDTWNWFFQP